MDDLLINSRKMILDSLSSSLQRSSRQLLLHYQPDSATQVTHRFCPMPHQSRVQYQIMGVPIIPKPLCPARGLKHSQKIAQGCVEDAEIQQILRQYPELIRSKHLIAPLIKNSMKKNYVRRSVYISPVIENN